MADQIRTLPEILALLADNNSGDISAQDVRDLTVSVWNYEFNSRDDFVASPPELADGAIVAAGPVVYQADALSTAIPDLPGWIPFGLASLEHWGAEGVAVGKSTYMATPTVDESEKIQSAFDWCVSQGSNLYGAEERVYGVGSQIVWGANGFVVPSGSPCLYNFQFVWIGAADTPIDKTDPDPDNWAFSNEAALIVGGADGSTPGKYSCFVQGLKGDGQRRKNVIQFRQMFSVPCDYFAERGLDYEARIGQENDDSLNTTNCRYNGRNSRHYAFQERSDGTFGPDDGTGWYGLSGRTSVGHLIESSDIQIEATGNTGFRNVLVRESFNVEMHDCKWWSGPGPGNPPGFVSAVVTKNAVNCVLTDSFVQDGAAQFYNPNVIVDNVRFTQYTHDPIQLVTDTADSTWDPFKIVNCIADFSDTNIALNAIGSGSWKFFGGTFFGNSNYLGAPLTIQGRQWNIGDVRDPFHTRGELVFALDTLGWEPPTGRSIQVGDLGFVGSAGATSISDMPGVNPLEPITPNHFGDNTTPGSTDMSGPLGDAIAYDRDIYLQDEQYLFARDSGFWTLDDVRIIGRGKYGPQVTFDRTSSGFLNFFRATNGGGIEGCNIQITSTGGASNSIQLIQPTGSGVVFRQNAVDGGSTGANYNFDLFAALDATDANAGIIEENDVENLSWFFLKTNAATSEHNRWKVLNNLISNMNRPATINSPNGDAIDWLWEGNTFNGNNNVSGFGHLTGCAGGDGFKFIGNTFFGDCDECLHFEESDRFVVTGNVANVNGSFVQILENSVGAVANKPNDECVIANNTARGRKATGEHGIQSVFDGGGPSSRRLVVTGNVLRGFDRGVDIGERVAPDASLLVQSNEIYDCNTGILSRQGGLGIKNNSIIDCTLGADTTSRGGAFGRNLFRNVPTPLSNSSSLGAVCLGCLFLFFWGFALAGGGGFFLFGLFLVFEVLTHATGSQDISLIPLPDAFKAIVTVSSSFSPSFYRYNIFDAEWDGTTATGFTPPALTIGAGNVTSPILVEDGTTLSYQVNNASGSAQDAILSVTINGPIFYN